MDGELAFEEAAGHALVVDEGVHGLPDLGIGEARVREVQGDVIGIDGWLSVERDGRIVGEGGDLVGGEVAGDVDVAFLEEQELRGGIGDVLEDHPIDRRGGRDGRPGLASSIDDFNRVSRFLRLKAPDAAAFVRSQL